MATKNRTPVNAALLESAKTAAPKNPAVTSADKAYLRGLKKRGFTDDEIIQLSAKAGLKVTAEMLAVKPRKAKPAATVAAPLQQHARV